MVVIRIKQGGTTKSLYFNSLSQAEFRKTIKVKWVERMELHIANEGRYFEKA